MTKTITKPRRTQAERLAETRKKLLDAAFQTIEDGGYSACTFKGVASRANLTTGAVQHHFQSRADLLIAVILERVFPQDIAEPVPAKPSHTVEQICEYMIALQWRYYSGTEHIVMWEITFGARHDDEVQEVISNFRNEVLKQTQRELFDAFKFHELTRAQIEQLMHFTLVKLSGLGLMKMQIVDADAEAQVELLTQATIDLVYRFKSENEAH